VLFAITDIETTGSYASAHSITEIAICLFDGIEVIEEYQTLINPGVPIPRFITGLTGITDEMLEDAPSFHEVAEDIHNLLKDAVFVAHNVNFDYSFIRAEFQACGVSWQPRKLCTVRLARKAFPGLRSYGLENLCSELGIINEAAHRALGDTRAALEVFARVRKVLSESELNKMIARGSGEHFLPNHLDEAEFIRLPEQPGVYYFLDKSGKPVYIGKANNLRKRVRTHFSPATESERHQQFLKEIHHVDFTPTGNELIALLLEDAEIRKHWPRHNQAQKRPPARLGVFFYEDGRGMYRLSVNKVSASQQPIRHFSSQAAAHKWLVHIADHYGLNYAAIGLPVERDFNDVNIQLHNSLLKEAISVRQHEQQVILLGPGRNDLEYGFVLFRDSQPTGYGFISKEFAIQRPDDVVDFLTPLRLTETNSAIARSYLEDPRGMRLISFADKPIPGYETFMNTE